MQSGSGFFASASAEEWEIRAREAVKSGKGPRNIWNWRVVDLLAYRRLRQTGASVYRASKECDIPHGTACKIESGDHWQLQPERVRQFNACFGVEIDPETGIAPAEVISAFGGGPKAYRDRLSGSGVEDEEAQPKDVPSRIEVIDTQYLTTELEKKLRTALNALTVAKLESASPRDLSSFISMAIEKRALLRNEPTQIIGHEHRERLEKVIPILLAEARRRNLAVPKLEPELITDADFEEVE